MKCTYFNIIYVMHQTDVCNLVLQDITDQELWFSIKSQDLKKTFEISNIFVRYKYANI